LCAAQAQYLRATGDDVRFVTFVYDAQHWIDKLDGIEVRVAERKRWTDALGWPPRVAKLRNRGARAIEWMDGLDLVLAHNFPCGAMLGASKLALRKVWQCNEPPRGLHIRLANPVLSAHAEANREGVVDAATAQWRTQLDRTDGKHRLSALRQYDVEQVARLDHVYAISEFSRDNARRIYGRCDDEVVYPIVRFPDGGRVRTGVDHQTMGVLVHSRLEVLKNIDTVIRGFARFRAATRAKAHLHLVGEGPARPWLEQLAATELAGEGFTFHGYLPDADLRRVYDACDVFALLPLDEPFGMVFPEAAAKGLLLIGPNHGGPLEILDNGRLGWCIDAFSPDALADALGQAHSMPGGEADKRRREADQACRARFSLQVIGPQLRQTITRGAA
jgi:glycosyltransferase involved in cell wall biosynthesis